VTRADPAQVSEITQSAQWNGSCERGMARPGAAHLVRSLLPSPHPGLGPGPAPAGSSRPSSQPSTWPMRRCRSSGPGPPPAAPLAQREGQPPDATETFTTCADPPGRDAHLRPAPAAATAPRRCRTVGSSSRPSTSTGIGHRPPDLSPTGRGGSCGVSGRGRLLHLDAQLRLRGHQHLHGARGRLTEQPEHTIRASRRPSGAPAPPGCT
jgi:hypothetical protein